MWIEYSAPLETRPLDRMLSERYSLERDVRIHNLIMAQWRELITHNEYLGVALEEVCIILRNTHHLASCNFWLSQALLSTMTGFAYKGIVGYTGVAKYSVYKLINVLDGRQGSIKWTDFIICLIRSIEKLTGAENLADKVPCRHFNYVQQIKWLMKFYLEYYKNKDSEWE